MTKIKVTRKTMLNDEARKRYSSDFEDLCWKRQANIINVVDYHRRLIKKNKERRK